jgi:hypothetical protein
VVIAGPVRRAACNESSSRQAAGQLSVIARSPTLPIEQSRRAVDNNSFVPKNPPFVRWSLGARLAHGIIALVTMSQPMTHSRALKSLLMTNPPKKVAPFTTHLTAEQLECLSRCARGISIRFERSEIVDALVASGYAEQGVAGVVTVTAKGQQYLRRHGK